MAFAARNTNKTSCHNGSNCAKAKLCRSTKTQVRSKSATSLTTIARTVNMLATLAKVLLPQLAKPALAHLHPTSKSYVALSRSVGPLEPSVLSCRRRAATRTPIMLTPVPSPEGLKETKQEKDRRKQTKRKTKAVSKDLGPFLSPYQTTQKISTKSLS